MSILIDRAPLAPATSIAHFSAVGGCIVLASGV